ncbi:MAG: 3-hydroxyacyl-ACP dehydratase FabZ [Nitrospirota bacterium]|jgi:beta-hydroxyacyl-ACP dehydratase FabZ
MIDIKEIQSILPHRYPFLLIDRILELEQGKRIVGIKNVTINEPFFQGHFPGNPIMPGVLILEAMAQIGGILAIKSTASLEGKEKIALFLGIEKAKFRKPVVPGDQLRFEIEVIHERMPIWKVSAKAFVDGKVVCESELTAMVTEKKNE